MSIVAFIGSPGDCKTYSLVDQIYRELARGRTCLTQFAVRGCTRLERLPDLLHPANMGAAVGIDEVARIFPARDWTDEDEVEAYLFEVHRHYGLDIYLAFQDPMQVSAALRRLVERFVYCYRCSIYKTDITSRLKGKGIVPKWWQLPLAVRQVSYLRNQMDPSRSAPRGGSDVTPAVRYIWFRRHIAMMYDTTERTEHAKLRDLILEALEGAEERLQQTWLVIDGKHQGESVLLQRARDIKKSKKLAAAEENAETKPKLARKKIELKSGYEYGSKTADFVEGVIKDAEG